MKIKIFFSYSTNQRDILDKIIEHLGHDYTIVDNFTLEDGEDVWEEIKKAIENSTHFVFLMSKDAINSKWCQSELSYAKEMADNDEIKFMSFRINDTICIEELGRKKWLKNYVSNEIYGPSMLSRLLIKKIREEVWKSFPEIEKKNKLFIGRDYEIAKIQQDYWQNFDTAKKALILSGFPHIGRRKILKEFINRIASSQNEEFVEIKLTDNDDLSQFVIQLNDITERYSYEELLSKLNEGDAEILNSAIHLLNEIQKKHFHVVIEDDKCVVIGNGRVAKWFVDLVKSDKLSPHLHLNVASRYTPLSTISSNFPEIMTYPISVMDRNNMKTLFVAYAKIMGVELTFNEVENFLNEISVYPEHAFFAIDNLKKTTVSISLKNTKQRRELYDGNFSELTDEIKKDESLFITMLVLSLFEFISYDTLNELLEKDCVDDIEKLYHLSVLEFYGTNKKYICLSHAFGDYLRRAKIKLPNEVMYSIRNRTKYIFSTIDKNIVDMSFRLFATKEYIKEQNSNVDEKYLLPSFVLKVVTEEYYDGKDKNVISLCKKLINSHKKTRYDEIMRSIHYWLCCSLCRERNSDFLKEITYFDDQSYSYFFLYGFYWRHKHKYEKAEEYYEEAISRKKICEDDAYISKAQHEMVIVQTHLGHYHKALNYAEDSYKHDKTNSYHIEAYFRCLVRSLSPDRVILNRLMSEMEASQDVHKNIIVPTMKAEYEFYINKNFSKSYSILMTLLQDPDRSFHNYPLRSLREICKAKDNMKLYNKTIKEYSLTEDLYFDEDK